MTSDWGTIRVLDHGFVKLRNISGPTRRQDAAYDADDTDPANSARMSFNRTDSGRTREEDIKLARYLMRNHHTTPVEMVECWIEMKLPIFVARQFVRHRTVTINEVSGRYIQLPKEWYIPEVVGGASPGKKQGQANNLQSSQQIRFQEKLNEHCRKGYLAYSHAIAAGVAPEHARLFLTLNHYTHWLWKQDLHNIMHFLSLRDHPHAQLEAQLYAKAIERLLRSCLPELMALYTLHRKRT